MESRNRTPDARNALARDDTPKPDFARGIREGPEADVEVEGRFSEGVEQTPETPEKTTERRFSEGVEQTPETPDKTTERRFSEGVEQSPTST